MFIAWLCHGCEAVTRACGALESEGLASVGTGKLRVSTQVSEHV